MDVLHLIKAYTIHSKKNLLFVDELSAKTELILKRLRIIIPEKIQIESTKEPP